MSQEASLAWDRHAETYGRLFAPLTSYLAHSMFRLVEDRLPVGARVLDIACGTGALAIAALRRAKAEDTAGRDGGLVLATDFSTTMVETTRRAGAELGAGDRLRCEVHDGQALALEDESFDAAFSSFGIFLFPDRKAGWREAARVLKRGGLFATTVWRGPEHNPMLREQMAPIMAALPERLKVPPSQGHWTEIASADALASEITSAGPFTSPEVFVLQASLAVPSPRTCWAAMNDNPVMSTLLRQCTPSELAAVETSVLDGFAARAGGRDRPFVLDSSCHVLVARKG